MYEDINSYFTLEMIYLWLNIGVLPFWFILFFFPESKLSQVFVASIFPILLLSLVYCYLCYLIFKDGYNFLNNFKLYLGLDELINLFSEKYFLIVFWSHFLAINLFCGGWIVNDYQKFSISKILIFFPLIITYFVGPLGLMIYWIIKIFYSKRISLYD